MSGSRKELYLGEECDFKDPQGIRGRITSIIRSLRPKPQIPKVLTDDVASELSEKTIHLNNGQLSCQIVYLQRTDLWESGVLAVPYEVWPDIREDAEDPKSRVYFDLETYYMPEDLGYSRRYTNNNRNTILPKQRLGLAVTINNTGQVECWDECQAEQLISHLLSHRQVISYNGLRFDNIVLSAYSTFEQGKELRDKTFDLYIHLQNIHSLRRKLTQWTQEYTGRSNTAKFFIDQGFGFKESEFGEGFDTKNTIPFMLRRGTAAQRRLVWVACFEDTYNTRLIYNELPLEEKLKKLKQLQEESDSTNKSYPMVSRRIPIFPPPQI